MRFTLYKYTFFLVPRIWASQGAALLARSICLPVQDSKILVHDVRIWYFATHSGLVFMTSLIQTSGHKTAAITVMFSRLSSVYFILFLNRAWILDKQSLNSNEKLMFIYHFPHSFPVHRARGTSCLRFSFKGTSSPSQAELLVCSKQVKRTWSAEKSFVIERAVDFIQIFIRRLFGHLN